MTPSPIAAAKPPHKGVAFHASSRRFDFYITFLPMRAITGWMPVLIERGEAFLPMPLRMMPPRFRLHYAPRWPWPTVTFCTGLLLAIKAFLFLYARHMPINSTMAFGMPGTNLFWHITQYATLM